MSNADRVEQLLRWEATWPKQYGSRRTTELLGSETRLLAKEVLRLRSQLEAA